MFNQLKAKHLKRVLWILTLIIVPSFSFFGVFSYLQNRNQSVIGQIGKRKVTRQYFNLCLRMAELNYLFMYGEEEARKVSYSTYGEKAWEYVMLLDRVEKEKITVTDKEVIEHIRKTFFGDDAFDIERYNRIVKYRFRLETREFEEIMRNFLMIEELYDKYISVEITDEEVLNLYKENDQQAKIAYLLLLMLNLIIMKRLKNLFRR